MLQKHPHPVLPLQLALRPQVVVIPGLARIGALGAAARMPRPGAGPQGELVVPRDHHPCPNFAGQSHCGLPGAAWGQRRTVDGAAFRSGLSRGSGAIPLIRASTGASDSTTRCAARAWGFGMSSSFLIQSLRRHRLPILGLLIGMAGRGAVILEKFSVSQFYFLPPSDSLRSRVTDCSKILGASSRKTDAPAEQPKLNSEHPHQHDPEQSVCHGLQYNASSSTSSIVKLANRFNHLSRNALQ